MKKFKKKEEKPCEKVGLHSGMLVRCGEGRLHFRCKTCPKTWSIDCSHFIQEFNK